MPSSKHHNEWRNNDNLIRCSKLLVIVQAAVDVEIIDCLNIKNSTL